MGIGTTRINVWHLLMCADKCTVIGQKVISHPDMAPFSAVLWSGEGVFFILDVRGNVYLVK